MPHLNVSCRLHQRRTLTADLDNRNVRMTVVDPLARAKITLLLQPDSVRRLRDELTRCLDLLEPSNSSTDAA